MSENNKLFSQFPPVTTEEWMDKVKTDLKGADFDRKLVWRSKEGITVNPFYRAEDLEKIDHLGLLPGEYPFVRGNGDTSNSWFIRQDILVSDAVEANKKALEILNRGVDSLGFIFPEETEFTTAYMEALLEGVFIESVELNFCPQGSAIELFSSFMGVIEKRGIKPSLVKGLIETDPLGRLMVNGKLCIKVDDSFDYLAKLIEANKELVNFRLVGINGANYSNAGASLIQELGFTIAMASEYLSGLSGRGIDPGKAAKALSLKFGIGSNYFFEIARLRAARILWAALAKKYAPDDPDAWKVNIHGVTSDWNKTIYDPYVNLLRTQTEAMSASLGGVDSLTVKPFNAVYDETNPFSERIARNQQLLLKEEAHFDRVVDPSAGSYYIEQLTSEVAEKAWELFMQTEADGGFLEALRKGSIQKQVEENAAKRDNNVARGKEKFLGTNIFPARNEKVELKKSKVEEKEKGVEVKPLRIYRGAEAFEHLRHATSALSGIPKVFMLTIGNPVMRKARAQFSSNFFAVAGYDIIDNIGFGSPGEGVEAALEAEADIVVLCSSDEEYEEFAPAVYDGLGGKAIFVVAGAPACEPQLREKGIENFISIKSDILATLTQYSKLLGINLD